MASGRKSYADWKRLHLLRPSGYHAGKLYDFLVLYASRTNSWVDEKVLMEFLWDAPAPARLDAVRELSRVVDVASAWAPATRSTRYRCLRLSEEEKTALKQNLDDFEEVFAGVDV